ncbi:MAG: hypothetical protein MUC30_01055 [Bacteroidales bacterium]|jgi:hypothetical protein|nr:hypothetical protein [Bacteroidales bacterium]
MKTLAKSLLAITCLLMVVGCEDDRIYPSPQKYTPQAAVVTSEIHIAAEFTAKFDRILTNSDDLWQIDRSIADYVFWSGLKDPVYLLRQSGTVNNPELGVLELTLCSVWSSVDGACINSGCLQNPYGDKLYLWGQNTAVTLNNEFPYNKADLHEMFSYVGMGKFDHCSGALAITCHVSEADPAVMEHYWDGNLTVVKGQ